mgnify:CR=1 FL=1
MLQFFFCLSALLWETMKSIRASHLHSEREMGLLSGIFCHNTRVAECCWGSFSIHQNIFQDVLELDFLHGGNSGRQMLFGMPAAWGLARYSFRVRKTVYRLFILVMMMPFQVTMLSQYLVLNRLGMLDRPQSVVLPGIFATFSVFIMYRFFRGIPENVMEAARMDGAGEFQIFLRIGIPLGSPGILSALVFSFLDCFSMLEQPMTFLKTKSLWPLSLFLPEITSQNAGFSLCASLVTILPAMFVFLAGQDYLEQGIAMAGAKE